MKTKYIGLIFIAILFKQKVLATDLPQNPIIAPGSVSASTATLVWDKPEHYKNVTRYHILLNGREVGVSEKCNYMLNGLKHATAYLVTLKAESKDGNMSAATRTIKFVTRAASKIVNVVSYGAKGDGRTLNTRAIQNAIDDCPLFGTVVIPSGKFVSGALYLKSNMTLQIDKGGVLQGSDNVEDYLPMMKNRFEGWEMETYSSLINAGTLNNKSGYTTENISIKGYGTIRGGGGELGKKMIDSKGIRSRGRLILLMNCKNIELQGLTIENSPCWTIHYIYSKGITLHDLNIVSTARNGDGIDPDSSDDSYIFNCSFSTGDDCIAIKSGKNPEGYIIGRPTTNVRITDCNFIKGHGISIGSEMSGGVSNVLVRDCQAGPLLYGMQIKGTKDRGGYVRNVNVLDCRMQQITIFSAVNYNNDGAPAPVVPTFENFSFSNIDLTTTTGKAPVIDINGFSEPGHLLKNVSFSNITTIAGAKVKVSWSDHIKFENIKTVDGKKPDFEISNSESVSY